MGRGPRILLRQPGGARPCPTPASGAYLVAAVPAHGQLVLVASSLVLRGQEEAAVLRQGEQQLLGEGHWVMGTHREQSELRTMLRAQGLRELGADTSVSSGRQPQAWAGSPKLRHCLSLLPCGSPRSPSPHRGYLTQRWDPLPQPGLVVASCPAGTWLVPNLSYKRHWLPLLLLFSCPATTGQTQAGPWDSDAILF